MQVNRRAVVSALALGFVVGAAPSVALAAAPTELGAVRLDTSPIAARDLPNYAKRVSALGTPAVNAALAGRLTGGRAAPTLVLSLSLVQLTSDPSSSGRRGVSTDSTDTVEGDAILVDARGREIARKHISLPVDPSAGERISTPAGEDRRIATMCANFAYWATRELGL